MKNQTMLKIKHFSHFDYQQKSQALIRIHSPECFQILSIDDVWDLWGGQTTGSWNIFQHLVHVYSLMHAYMYLYYEDSPNPMPSYCSRSRSMVCLMTASLAPWRRPCRPLIPFISSICSSSESNLWRYLHIHETTHKLTKHWRATKEILLFYTNNSQTAQIRIF